jgi:hypothetical protein
VDTEQPNAEVVRMGGLDNKGAKARSREYQKTNAQRSTLNAERRSGSATGQSNAEWMNNEGTKERSQGANVEHRISGHAEAWTPNNRTPKCLRTATSKGSRREIPFA